MTISLFVNGNQTIIGIKDTSSETKIIEIDSKIIFFDPELFRERFLLILKNSFNINTFNETDELIFAVPGPIDPVTSNIIHSYNLNEISFGKNYDGFSFKSCFEDIVSRNNIFVINDAQAAGLGVSKYLEPELPCLVLTNDLGLGVALIKQAGQVESREWGSERHENGRMFHNLLDNQFVNQRLIANTKDILGDYTENWIATINRMIKLAPENSVMVKSIIIISERSELIIKDVVKNSFQDYKITFPDKNEYSNIYINGCFSAPEIKKEPRVLKIEYYSGEEKIRDFENFEDFRDHWVSYRKITNGDNEYRFYYEDHSVKKVKIRHLECEEELKQYLF